MTDEASTSTPRRSWERSYDYYGLMIGSVAVPASGSQERASTGRRRPGQNRPRLTSLLETRDLETSPVSTMRKSMRERTRK